MANKTIGDLTAASTVDAADLVHVVQGGNSRQATVQQILDAPVASADKGDVVVAGSTWTVEGATPADGTFNVTGMATATTGFVASGQLGTISGTHAVMYCGGGTTATFAGYNGTNWQPTQIRGSEIALWINETQKASLTSAGIVFADSITSSGGGIGYTTGAGGTVTQITSKATGVTLSKLSGEITMNAASLAANTAVTFVLTNTTIAATDRIIINHKSGGTFGAYICDAQSAAGSATIMLRNLTAGALAEAVVLGFAVIKAATA